LGDDFRRVAGEVPTQDLHDAPRMLQGGVALCGGHVPVWRGVRLGVAIDAVTVKPMPSSSGLRLSWMPGIVLLFLAIVPGLVVAPMTLPSIVGIVLLVEAAKHPCQFFSIPEAFFDDGRSVRVAQDVFVKPTIVA